MFKQLDKARKGKPRGPKKSWTKSRYLIMLIHYELRSRWYGRLDALEWTAKKERIGVYGEQDCNIKKVEEKITRARKEVPDWEEHLSHILKCFKPI